MSKDKKELFENKRILSAIFSLALPSVVGQIILVIYNMADTFFVGLTANDSMITAVTVCMPAFMFLSAISNLFGIGGAGVISRALGKEKTEKARSVTAFSFWGCLFVTMIYALFCFLFIDLFLNLLGGSDPFVHSQAKKYFIVAVIIGGIPTAMSTMFSHILRSQGHSVSASIGIIIGGLLNIGLDPLFMFAILKSGNEVLGAGIATAISNVVSLIYFFIVIRKKKDELIISFKPEKNMLKNGIPWKVIRNGLPACLMTLCENISYAVLDNLMFYYGTSAQAGLGVAKKVNMLAHSVVRGIAQGVLPLIGYNYASHNFKRMKKAVSASMAIAITIALACTAANITLSYQLIGIFISGTSMAHEYGKKFLEILCIGAPFSACAYMVISFFEAIGKAYRSLCLALLRKGILDIPMMFILNNFYPTYGIVAATPIADVICCIISIILIIVFIKKKGKKIQNEKR